MKPIKIISGSLLLFLSFLFVIQSAIIFSQSLSRQKWTVMPDPVVETTVYAIVFLVLILLTLLGGLKLFKNAGLIKPQRVFKIIFVVLLILAALALLPALERGLYYHSGDVETLFLTKDEVSALAGKNILPYRPVGVDYRIGIFVLLEFFVGLILLLSAVKQTFFGKRENNLVEMK
jgi:hypothetical protein